MGIIFNILRRYVIRVTCSVLLMTFPDGPLYARKPLPENYILFRLKRTEQGFEGGSEFMRLSIDLPDGSSGHKINKEILFSMIEQSKVSGSLAFLPSENLTPVDFEIVQFRGQDDVYMKTATGYFLWEEVHFKRRKLSFVFNWWYCPPAQEEDLEILHMTERLLGDPVHWNRNDDRVCDMDIQLNCWSLFCALRHASITVMNEYNHHNTALQAVRNVIIEIYPDFEFGHTLRDFNNSPETSYEEILYVIRKAREKISLELYGKSQNPTKTAT